MSLFDLLQYPVETDQEGTVLNGRNIPAKFWHKYWTYKESIIFALPCAGKIREIILNWNEEDERQYNGHISPT